MGTIYQYDTVVLLEDLNPKIKKGMIGAILEKYTENDFEVEFPDKDGVNFTYENQFTFVVNRNQIKKVN
jgi:hypothetical protein